MGLSVEADPAAARPLAALVAAGALGRLQTGPAHAADAAGTLQCLARLRWRDSALLAALAPHLAHLGPWTLSGLLISAREVKPI